MNSMLGIGSGLDLSTMLDSLVRVSSEPKIRQLGQKEVEAKDAISGLGTLKSLMSDFKSASDALKDTSLYGQRTASVTQPSSGEVLTATATSTAQTGSYDIKVNNLAVGSRAVTGVLNTDHDAALTFAGTADGDGVKDTLRFYLQANAGVNGSPENTDPAPFEIDLKDGMSLNDIVKAVNEHEDNFGVTASVVDGKLIYESSVTGADNQLEVNSTRVKQNADYGVGKELTGWADFPADVISSQGSYLRDAESAEIEFNGLTVTRDTNTLDDVVSGVTFNLKGVSTDEAKVAIGDNTGAVKSKIEAFASAYNKLREGMNEMKGSYDEDTEEFTYGKLTGDPIIRNVESILGSVLTNQVAGAEVGADTLYAIGLEIESDGTLNVDSGRLGSAMSNHFEDISKLFAGDDGIASQVSGRLDPFLGFDGAIKGKEDSYNDILKDLEKQYEDHTRYIESYQKTLTKQFTALDSTVGRLQLTMQQVGPQLAQLANISYSSGGGQ